MRTDKLNRAVLATAASALVLAPLAGCAGSDPDPASSTPAPATEPARPTESQQQPAAEYADGTYTARGVYGGAPSYMDFTVTIDDDIITEVESALMEPNNATSRGYQERFAAALPDEVIGKSIDEVEVGFLAGSSSCGDGFNDAIAQIREQAGGSDAG